jgi:Domain of unknown function (DUF4145)
MQGSRLNYMQSLNFEELCNDYPELADLGGFAEQYVYSDPEGAVAKLRKFGEALARAIWRHYRLPRLPETQSELLKTPTFVSNVPRDILDKFHSVRRTGNDGIHPSNRPVTKDAALSRLKDAHDLGKWWAMPADKSGIESFQIFRTPPRGPVLPPEVQEKLKEQERLLEKTLADLENLRKQYHQATQDDTRLKVLRKRGEESAHLLRLVPDEFGLARGVRLFRYLAEQANRGKPVGISYGDFIAFLHGKSSFKDVAGRNYLPGDSGPVIKLAWSITEANGCRIAVTAGGRTIQSGMDSFIWQSHSLHDRAEKAFHNPKCTLPYSRADWKAVFPDGRRRLATPSDLAI